MFTENTFTLLEGLAATPTKAFYEQHKNEIVADIQNPLRGMFQLVQQRMPESILCTLETEKRILSNVLKNDYGQGGAHDYLWGAFYPKGHKRSHSAQLFLTITKNDLAAGFYVGENGEDVKKRFKENCKKPEALLFAAQLDERFRNSKIAYGSKKPQLPIESDSYNHLESFAEWFQRVDDVGAGARVFFNKEEVLRLSSAELAEKVSELFIKFFPLFFIALEEDPFPAIEAFQNGTGIEQKTVLSNGIKEEFKQYLSGLLRSDTSTFDRYIKSIEVLGELVSQKELGFDDCSKIWHINAKDRLIELQECLRRERGLGAASKWNQPSVPDYYLHKGFFHAALTHYINFLTQKTNANLIQVKGGANVLPNNPAYSVAECARESGFSVEDIEQWVRAINRKGQAIFYGAPGTGKTFIADKLARHLIGNGNGFDDLIQFHPAYSYEDFIEGIRPATEGGQLSYAPAAGRFLDFCKKAEGRDGICVLIIDEINRANLSRVFGELMYLLEYRDKEMVLSGGTNFRIPNNVRIIGTMNTADRSIALVDHALRRRFSFISLSPRYEVIESFHEGTDFQPSELIKVLKSVNAVINDKHYHIGISFFLREDLRGEIADIWNLEIEPYLEEFFFDQQEKMEQFRWSKIESKVLGA